VRPEIWAHFLDNKNLQKVMKRVIIRRDLMSKTDYSKKYNVSRPTIDKMIEEGKLVVESISGTDFIRLEKK